MRIAAAVGARLSGKARWSVGIGALTAIGALAWTAGLASWLVIVIGLAVLSTVALVAARAGSRGRRASPAPMAGRITSLGRDFDPEEVITQDANSGRIWRLADVHFLGAAEKRRLAAERPHVWKAYRARLFPLSPVRSDGGGDSRPAPPPRGDSP